VTHYVIQRCHSYNALALQGLRLESPNCAKISLLPLAERRRSLLPLKLEAKVWLKKAYGALVEGLNK
jgi:hypothetical protein